jgi:hypothetical protein
MITLDPTTVLELPVDQLGLIVLEDFVNSRGWNERNYILEAQQHRGYHGEAMRALAEAFAWLKARGLTAADPDQSSTDAIFVTRIGRHVLQDGPDSFYATERLQRGLHPAIERKARPQFLIGEYEQGVFSALKTVEVRVRKLAGFGNDGRQQIGTLTQIVLDVFDDFHYIDEARSANAAFLVARARVDGQDIEMVDHIRLDPDGKIREVTTFFRPLPATAVALRLLGAGLGLRKSRIRAAVISGLSRPLGFMTRAGDGIGVRLVRPTL